jgi:peptidoglycan/LPS O-acetylase OafA/YrhL
LSDAAPPPAQLKSLRENNFDLLRLAAASQVAVLHADRHLHFQGQLPQLLCRGLEYFPGVPIFFVISGYLISLSLEVNPQLRDYFRNRALRIFPGLWVCQLLTLLSALLFLQHWPPFGLRQVAQLFKWFLEAFTWMPVATPPFLSGYGTGGLNGSLWTISVELQFYLFLPLLTALLRRVPGRTNLVLLGLLVALYPFGAWYDAHREAYWPRPGFQMLGLTLLPYLHMFLIGVLLQKNFTRLAWLIRGRAAAWFLGYVVIAWVLRRFGYSVDSNIPNILGMAVLGMAIVSAAYTLPYLAERLLHRNDISYGVYIYHMVVINAFVEYGLLGSNPFALAALALSFLLAYLSWRWVEKPCLARKRHALRSVPSAHAARA